MQLRSLYSTLINNSVIFTESYFEKATYFLNIAMFKNRINKKILKTSDESEPIWLEPELELKDFQLGMAWLVTFSPSARNRNEPKTSFLFLFFYF